MESLPAVQQAGSSMFFDIQKFEHAHKVAQIFLGSTMVPEHFKNSLGNVLIAMNYADRIGADLFMTMQNMCVIHGKPGVEGKLVIALLNNSGRFEPVEFEETGNLRKPESDDHGCIAFAKDIRSGKILKGPMVDWAMVKAEGWFGKNGSKWKTMAPLMFRYRAATYFARTYCPELLLGMQTREEIQDVVTLRQNDLGEYETDADKDMVDVDASMEERSTSLYEDAATKTSTTLDEAGTSKNSASNSRPPETTPDDPYDSMDEPALWKELKGAVATVGIKSDESFARISRYIYHCADTTGEDVTSSLKFALKESPAVLVTHAADWDTKKQQERAGNDWDPTTAPVMKRYVADKAEKVKAVADSMGIPTNNRIPADVHADILAASQEPPEDPPETAAADADADREALIAENEKLRAQASGRWSRARVAVGIVSTNIHAMTKDELQKLIDQYHADTGSNNGTNTEERDPFGQF